MKRVLVISQNGLLMKDKIAIIGLGYVGLPLALNFAEQNYEVFGFDIDINKIKRLI